MILATENGGSTWLSQTPPAAATVLNGISCSSDTTCLATGSHVVGTTDGGSTWSDLGTPAGTTALVSVSCINTSVCTAVGGANILTTTNDGTGWTSEPAPSGVASLLGVACASLVNCEAVGTNANSGGAIATLSAPPNVTTTSLAHWEPSACPMRPLFPPPAGCPRMPWAVTGGTLPPGIHLASNGTLSGTPTISGRYQVIFTVTDSNFLSTPASLVISIQPLGAPGYWEVASDGGIFSYGGAQFYGSTRSLHLNAPIVSTAQPRPTMAATGCSRPTVASSASAAAVFYGSTGGMHLNASPSSPPALARRGGYWLVASDGGIFSFGDAAFYGSTGGLHLDKPIVGMASTIDGHGYWLVASDGGIFAFGDAAFFGSTGGLPLQEPIVAMTSAPDGSGYWLVASDGGIFSFGDVGYFGSAGGMPINAPVVGMDRTADGQGYWMVGRDGGIYNYGDAGPYGSAGGLRPDRPIVGMTAIQSFVGGSTSVRVQRPAVTTGPSASVSAPECPTLPAAPTQG